jgi:hypothetical protein
MIKLYVKVLGIPIPTWLYSATVMRVPRLERRLIRRELQRKRQNPR